MKKTPTATSPIMSTAMIAAMAPPEIPLDEALLPPVELFPTAGVAVADLEVDALVTGVLVEVELVGIELVGMELVGIVFVGIGVVEDNVDDVENEVEVGDVGTATAWVVITTVDVDW